MQNIIRFLKSKIILPIKVKYWVWTYKYYDHLDDCGMKHIWGLKSYDDLSSAECSIHTMNDFDITYYEETDDYAIGVETMFMFNSENGDRKYLQMILEQFTDWMKEKNYQIDNRLSLYGVFTEGYDINKHFKTIPELYAYFKMIVNGYCSL